MTNAEKETIETFCLELTLALRRITGETIDIQPNFSAAPGEDNQQPVWAHNRPALSIDLHIE
jgi:hypothetical protein